MSFSREERDLLEELIDYTEDTWGVDTGRVLHLGLVMLGERDGCLWGVTEEEHAEVIQGYLDDLDVAFKTDNSGSFTRFFIAESETHLNNSRMTEGRGDGEFFGYPNDAIEWYESRSDPQGDFVDFLESETNYDMKEFDTENFLIEYIPAGTESSVQEAEQRQRQYASALKNSSVNFSRIVNKPQSL